VLSSDRDEVSIALAAPDYQVREMTINGNACNEVAVSGFASSEEPGRPRLPYKAILLGVPPDADVSLDISSAPAIAGQQDRITCPAAQTIAEIQEDGSLARDTAAWAPDAAVYATDAFYPSQIARVIDLGFMRSQRIVRVELIPLQVNPVTGETRYHPQAQLRVNFRGQTDSGQAVGEPADFEAIFQSMLANYDTARAWRAAAPRTAPSSMSGAAASPAAPAAGGTEPPTVGVWLPPTPGYRIAVDSEGIYQLTYQDLISATVPVTTTDPRTLKLYNFGQELAIRVLGEADGQMNPGDSIIFYGRGVNTRYTTQNVYWLTYGGANGRRMADQASAAGGATSAAFTETVHLEQNLRYVSTLPMAEGYDHWFNSQMALGGGATGSRDFGFTVKNPATGSYSATLEAVLGAVTIGRQHHLRLYVGQAGNLRLVLDTTNWYDKTIYQGTVSFPQSYLVAGANIVRVEIVNELLDRGETVYPDWFKIGYQRAYSAEANYLAFGGDQAGRWRFQVGGFSTDAVEAYDVTDPLAVKRILPGAALNYLYLPIIVRNFSHGTLSATLADAASAAATFTFAADQAGPRRYVAMTAEKRKMPISVQAAQAPDNLIQTSNVADYLMISHPDFLAALDPLATQRTSQGLRVKKINVQDVYDQFGYGMWSAEAIHAFLAHAYNQWTAPKPGFVLLGGDGNYDMRRYIGTSGPTYLPPYLAMIKDDPDTGESVADNRFVTLTPGDLLPEMHIGRFPVNNLTEITTMVNKILGYENSPAPGDWTKRILFATDDLSRGGGDFYEYSDGIADGYADPPTNTVKILPAPYTSTKVYMGNLATEPRATCPSENTRSDCRQKTIDNINAGTLMVSYIGHGTKTQWSPSLDYSGSIMDITALGSLTNADKLTIMLPMTCDNGYFAQREIGAESFGEASVRMDAGAVASWSPTGFGLASGHDLMERGLFLSVFQNHTRQLGVAATAGKVYLVQNATPGKYLDLLDTYLLLGDPALRIPLVVTQQ
jgi:hypothetical protein